MLLLAVPAGTAAGVSLYGTGQRPGTSSVQNVVAVTDLDGCPMLAQGMTGDCVALLQVTLNAAGASPELSADGIFGPRTDQAVREFQQRGGLVVDGVVGPVTKQLLRGETSVATPEIPAAPVSDPGYPDGFDPAAAARWAAAHVDEVEPSAWRRSDVDNHCTEFVSAALHEGGLRYTGSWAPGRRLRDGYHMQQAYYITKGLREWLVSKETWIDVVPLDLQQGSSAAAAGAAAGDIVYYDWEGNDEAHQSHVAIVTNVNGNDVTVVDQGEVDSHNTRFWDMSRSQPDKKIVEVAPRAHVTLLRWRR